MPDKFIERRIVTGFIVSTEYVSLLYNKWDPRYIRSGTATMLIEWCLDYYARYSKAPGRDIEGIFSAKLKEGRIQKDRVADIEDILESLSDEYDREQFNVSYLVDQTEAYFTDQNLRNFADDIRNAIDGGNTAEAERVANDYKPVVKGVHSAIDPFADRSRIRRAFEERADPLVRFSKALGSFWNDQFTRDAFVALLAPEKRGKSFMLMEIAFRAIRSGCNVIFFQAGDMSENQMLRRLCLYLARRSDQEKYCRGMFYPVLDCVENQNDSCNKDERECDFGFLKEDDDSDLTFSMLRQFHKDNPEYKPCRNCSQMRPTVWLQWSKPVHVLRWPEAYKMAKAFRKKHEKHFVLSTHASDSLSISEIRTLLDVWEKQENIVPDVIIVDYADLLASDPDCAFLQPRDQVNKIWQRLRSLSQARHCLVVTATQADANSYDRHVLGLSNFSEDKRKYAHVTGMYGLNQSDEEKKIGLLRINQLVVRDADFSVSNQVTVLQRLQMGRPYLGSF